jgi:Kef-type K+ transport system membrane component KefB
MEHLLDADSEWVRFLAASGAVVLTFLAGAELDPEVVRTKLTEVSVVGLIGFVAPFLGCAALAYYGLGWNANASWLCGVALSTTSMAVVYAVMMETGFNRTEFGKGILGSLHRRGGLRPHISHFYLSACLDPQTGGQPLMEGGIIFSSNSLQ